MPILGLKTLPVNHPMRRVYEISAGVIGVILIVWGAVGLLTSPARIAHIAMTTTYCVGCIVAGVVLVVAGVIGGNVAAHVNAWVGAALIVLGLVGMPLSRSTDEIELSDVITMFVVAMVLIAAGFYGQVGAASPHDVDRPEGDRPRDTAGDPSRAADPADVEK